MATKEELELLQDLFKDDPNLLSEIVKQESRKGIKETLSKPLWEDLVKQISIPGRSAQESAEVLQQLIPKDLPVPTHQELGGKLVGDPYGGSLAKIKETRDLVPISKNLPIPTGQELGSKLVGQPYGGALAEALPPSNLPAVISSSTKSSLGNLLKTIGKRAAPLVPIVGLGADIAFTEEIGEGSDIPRIYSKEPKLNKDLSPNLFERVSSKYAELAPTLQEGTPPAAMPPSPTTKEADPLKKFIEAQIAAAKPGTIATEEAGDRELLEAMKQRNIMQLASTIGGGLSQAIAGLTGTKPQSETFERLAKLAEQPIADIALKQKTEKEKLEFESEKNKRNPQSEISKAYRDFVKHMGFPVNEGVSALELEKITPIFEKAYYAKLSTEERKARQAESKSLREEQQRQLKAQRDIQNLSRYQESFNKDKLVQKAQEGLSHAVDAEKLLNIRTPITDEAVKTSLARLSGEVGVLTDRDVARFGGSKAIADRIQQSIQQMYKGTLTEQNRRFMQEMITVFKERRQDQLDKRALDYAKQGAKRFEVPVEDAWDFIMPGRKIPGKKDPKIEEWAKKYNKSYEEAEKILRSRGYGK